MKQLISNYSYNTVAKTVTLSDFTTVRLDRLQLITNVTTNAIIYNFADSSVATATVSGNVITLSAAPGSNTDKLMVIYDAASGDPTYDGYRELAGLTAGALNADLVPSTDVSAYKWISLQINGTFVGTLSFQGSNDGVNWPAGGNVILNNSNTAIASGVTATTGTGATYIGPVAFRYIRVRFTAYTSGTATGTVELYTQAAVSNVINAIATQSGTWSVGSNSATGSAVPANAFYMAGTLSAGTLSGLRLDDFGDGTNGANAAMVSQRIYNGTNFDRIRSATSAAGTTGTGVPAVGMLIFDGTNYIRPTTASSKTDAESGGSVLVNGNMVFNGTSWDRQRGNTSGTFTVAVAATTGGYTPAKLISAATTNATSIKASAGTIGYISAGNTTANALYLKIYDKATAPTVGTDVPIHTFIIPGGSTGAGSNMPLPPQGILCSNGIAIAITGAATDADTTAVTAGAAIINYGTK
jgi:hypothetical protein